MKKHLDFICFSIILVCTWAFMICNVLDNTETRKMLAEHELECTGIVFRLDSIPNTVWVSIVDTVDFVVCDKVCKPVCGVVHDTDCRNSLPDNIRDYKCSCGVVHMSYCELARTPLYDGSNQTIFIRKNKPNIECAPICSISHTHILLAFTPQKKKYGMYVPIDQFEVGDHIETTEQWENTYIKEHEEGVIYRLYWNNGHKYAMFRTPKGHVYEMLLKWLQKKTPTDVSR